MSSVLILCEIEKRLGLATVLSRQIQAAGGNVVGTAAQYLLVQFLKFFIVRFYDFFIHRDLPRLKTNFVASALICGAPVQWGCAAALGIRTCGDAVNLSRY